MTIAKHSTTRNTIEGGTDGTIIGNTGNRLNTTSSTSVSTYLESNQMYSAAWDVNATSSGADNPLLLLRNPLGSGKNLFIVKIFAGCTIQNVSVEFNTYANPTFNTTVANITDITQLGLSTTVTVTTATPHSATVGATATIAGTVNFNGNWTVATVTSATVYTFTKSAVLLTTTETTGTSSVPSSLGTARTPVPRFVGNSAPAAVALVNTLPTVSSNGTAMTVQVTGQNSNSLEYDDEFTLAIAPNNAILITGNPLSNNRNCVVTVIWAEVSV